MPIPMTIASGALTCYTHKNSCPVSIFPESAYVIYLTYTHAHMISLPLLIVPCVIIFGEASLSFVTLCPWLGIRCVHAMARQSPAVIRQQSGRKRAAFRTQSFT